MSEEFETNINETSTDVETNVTAKQEDVLIQLPAVIKTSTKKGEMTFPIHFYTSGLSTDTVVELLSQQLARKFSNSIAHSENEKTESSRQILQQSYEEEIARSGHVSHNIEIYCTNERTTMSPVEKVSALVKSGKVTKDDLLAILTLLDEK